MSVEKLQGWRIVGHCLVITGVVLMLLGSWGALAEAGRGTAQDFSSELLMLIGGLLAVGMGTLTSIAIAIAQHTHELTKEACNRQ